MATKRKNLHINSYIVIPKKLLYWVDDEHINNPFYSNQSSKQTCKTIPNQCPLPTNTQDNSHQTKEEIQYTCTDHRMLYTTCPPIGDINLRELQQIQNKLHQHPNRTHGVNPLNITRRHIKSSPRHTYRQAKHLPKYIL